MASRPTTRTTIAALLLLLSAVSGCSPIPADSADAVVAVSSTAIDETTAATAVSPATTGTTTSTIVTVTRSGPLDATERQILRRADQATVDRRFSEIAEILEPLTDRRPDDQRIEQRLAAAHVYQEQEAASVPYDGPVAHLFTHSLIVDTDAAFDGDFMARGYYDYMITVHEFKAMLHEMHEGGFILIDIHELFDEMADGTITPRRLHLPPGRKPFVLSIDDVSYYGYMTDDGFADALVIDDDLNVATRFGSAGSGGALDAEVTLDGDVVPILDQFIWDHPDFSYQGAKGILAVTGYEGAFGYDVSRDQVQEPDFHQRFSDLQVVSNRLRELGWTFASHSYTHSQDIKNKTMSLNRFVFDSDNWEREIASAIGPTDVYVSPFGAYFDDADRRYRYLIDDKGFNVFAPISDGTTIEWRDDNLVFHRLAIDGWMLDNGAERLAPYFDVDTVRDPARDRN